MAVTMTEIPGMQEGIETRMRHEELTPSSFARAAGLTAQGLDPVRAGQRKAYQGRTRIGVARALRWPEDWYDRFERGEDPATFPDVDWPSVSSVEDRLDALEAQVSRLAEQIERGEL